MPRLISLLILLIACNICFADDPKQHLMTREEMAVSLSDLAKKSESASDIEKLGAEIKNEYATLKYKQANPDSPQMKGSINLRMLWPNQLNSNDKDTKMDYLLNLSIYKKVGLTSSIQATFNSLDSGFNGSNLDLATKLLDFEARFKLGNIFYKATLGPGPYVHRVTDNLLYPEDGTVITRPKTGILAFTYFQDLNLSLGYCSHQMESTGNSSTKEAYGSIAYTKTIPLLGKTTFSAFPHLTFNDDTRDYIVEYAIRSELSKKLSGELLFSGQMAKASLHIRTNSTKINLTAYKLESSFRKPIDRYTLIYLNEFNKLIPDGSVDIGLSCEKKLNSKFSVAVKCDAALSTDGKLGADSIGSSLTSEIGLKYDLTPRASFYTYYRAFNTPSGQSNIDPSLSINVPQMSDIFGVEVRLII